MSQQQTEHWHEHDKPVTQGHVVNAAGPVFDQASDLVCGMMVYSATSRHRFDHGRTIYHFCSAGCRAKFAAGPDAYLWAGLLKPVPMISGTTVRWLRSQTLMIAVRYTYSPSALP